MAQPFPYFYHLTPKNEEFFNMKVNEFKEKLKQSQTEFQEETAIFQSVALSKIEGMPGTIVPL